MRRLPLLARYQSGETEEPLPDLEKQQYLFCDHQTLFGFFEGPVPDRAFRTL